MPKKTPKTNKAPKQTFVLRVSNSLLIKITAAFFALVIFMVLSVFIFSLLFTNRIYPTIRVAGIDLTGKTKDEAKGLIEDEIKNRLEGKILYEYQESTQSGEKASYPLELKGLSPSLGTEAALDEAFDYGRRKIYFKPVDIYLKTDFGTDLDDQTARMSQTIDRHPIDSQLKIEEDQITASPSQDGLEVDKEKIISDLEVYLNTGKTPSSILPVRKVYPKLSYDGALRIKNRLDQIKLTPLALKFNELTFTLGLQTILSFIDLQESEYSLASWNEVNVPYIRVGNQSPVIDTKVSLNKERIVEYLQSIAPQIDQPVEEPLFEYDPSSQSRVKQFRPPTEGRKLNVTKAAALLQQGVLDSSQTSINLPVDVSLPKNKLVNELGIKQLIGQGVSKFAGSIVNRIYNVGLGASKINGVLIPPGEEFSFVNTVGDISAATGFKQAYVIKAGRTVLDDGGGICQVSTTLFRAVLNSGLPITARTAHAYRVGYYEQGYPPGLDATVYYPSVDFKFKNDTQSHILIQSYVEGTTMYVDLYGTSDGRVSTVSKPVVTNRTSAPPELRQDDPTLPKGTVKQVDWAAEGATVVFNRTVNKDGQEIINETFRSNYRPWQAVYLVGTQ